MKVSDDLISNAICNTTVMKKQALLNMWPNDKEWEDAVSNMSDKKIEMLCDAYMKSKNKGGILNVKR